MPDFRNIFAFMALGAAALAGQALTMRELMAALRGNELSLALALGIWLLLSGLFSWAGGRLAQGLKDKKAAFALSLYALGVLLPIAVSLPRLMPSVLMGWFPGEVVPAGGMFLIILVTLLLVAPLAGLCFPLAVACAGRAGWVYSLESLGSFLMGVTFTFLIAPYLSPLQGAALASCVCFAAAYTMSGHRVRLAALPLIAASALLYLSAPSLELRLCNCAAPAGRVVEAAWSRYGAITVVELPGQHAVYVDGAYGYSIPDPDVAEIKAHLPLIVHANPERVLMVGGGCGGALAEALKEPVKSIDYVELDPRLIEVSMRYMLGADRAAFKDGRVNAHYEDGRRFIKDTAGRYDVVMVSLPAPLTASVNRYYTLEFFMEVSRILRPGGMFSISLPSSPNYIGKRQQALSGSIYHTLKAVFPCVRVTPEDTSYFFASVEPDAVSLDARKLSRRFAARGIHTRGFNEHTIQYYLQPSRVTYVEGRLAGSTGLGINRDFRPVAYLYALSVWGEVAGLPGLGFISGLAETPDAALLWLAIPIAILLLTWYFMRGGAARKAYCVITTTGFTGIVVEVAALLAFQARYGYLYEMVGLFMAIFMLGLFAGSRAVAEGRDDRNDSMSFRAKSRNPLLTLSLKGKTLTVGPSTSVGTTDRGFLNGNRRNYIVTEFRQQNLRALFVLECALALVCLCLLLLTAFPDTAFFGYLLALIILFTGALAGAEYPVALAAQGGVQDASAGRLYGVDLLGSSLGALVCGLVLVPLLGIAWTALFVLILKGFSACFLFWGGRA